MSHSRRSSRRADASARHGRTQALGAWVVPVLVWIAQPGPASADLGPGSPNQWFVDAELHSTLLSGILDREPLQVSYGLAMRVERQRERVGCSMSLDTTWWGSPELDPESEKVFRGRPQGVVVLSLGIAHRYFGGRMRFLWDAGPSVLLRNTGVDRRGTVGVVTNIRPTGVRLRRASAVVIDPLSFSLLIPDMGGIPMVVVQFRTVLAIELGVGAEG